MKFGRRGTLLYAIGCLILLLCGCSSAPEVPKAGDVQSVEINLGIPVNHGDPLPLPLDSGNAADRAVIEKLIGWLNTASVAGKGQEPIPNMGQHVVVLHLTNGTTISVTDARNKEEVLLYNGGKEPLHLKSPNLATWLSNGWKNDVHFGDK